MVSLADALSLSRLAIAPALPFFAAAGDGVVTTALFAWGFGSDAVDGTIARRSGTAGPRGAQLDSACDLAFYSSALVSFGLANPGIRSGMLPAMVVTGTALVVPSVVGWLKFGRIPSYHTVLSRVAVGAFACALLAFFAAGTTWPLLAAVCVATVAALDDILITVLLREPRADVPWSLSLMRRTRPPLATSSPRLRGDSLQ
jgi:CDP-diacylglycerol--glycerol-3-phosphate 3-phosphatidyltransferase